MIYIENFPTWFLGYWLGPIVFCALMSPYFTHWTFEQSYPLILTMQFAPFLSYLSLPLIKYVKSDEIKMVFWWPYIN